LAHRLIEELVNRYRAEVTAILPSRRQNHGPQISRIPGVRVIEADRLDIDALRQAKVSTADALALPSTRRRGWRSH
jgi:Trk K+ transport system NAD-binding subunit